MKAMLHAHQPVKQVMEEEGATCNASVLQLNGRIPVATLSSLH